MVPGNVRDEYDCDQCLRPIADRLGRAGARVQRRPAVTDQPTSYVDPDPWRTVVSYDLHPECEAAFLEEKLGVLPGEREQS
jgi:hypothetical protein